MGVGGWVTLVGFTFVLAVLLAVIRALSDLLDLVERTDDEEPPR